MIGKSLNEMAMFRSYGINYQREMGFNGMNNQPMTGDRHGPIKMGIPFERDIKQAEWAYSWKYEWDM